MAAGKSGRHARHPNVLCVPKNIQHLFEFSPAFMFAFMASLKVTLSSNVK